MYPRSGLSPAPLSRPLAPRLLVPVLALLQALAACTTSTRLPSAPDWQAHRVQLEALQHWTATGRVALRSGDAAESAALYWHQARGDSRVELRGPLGMATTTIVSDGQQLDIRRGDEHQQLDISSPEALRASTGWDLPLAALPYWLKGLPAPGLAIDNLELDPLGRVLAFLDQDGWEVRLSEYRPFDALSLPTRVEISRGDTRAKVLIRQWQTGGDDA